MALCRAPATCVGKFTAGIDTLFYLTAVVIAEVVPAAIIETGVAIQAVEIPTLAPKRASLNVTATDARDSFTTVLNAWL